MEDLLNASWLSSIGLATLCFLSWLVIKPFFNYLTSNSFLTLMSAGCILFIVGCGFWGYSKNGEEGAYYGVGISAALFGGSIIVWQFLRHLIKWSWNELEDGL